MNPSIPRSRPLDALLAELGAEGSRGDLLVTGITDDSRDVRPGYLFVAVPGVHEDGHDFAGEAARRGAAAIVAEHDLDVASVPVIRVAEARSALAALGAAWYGHPERDLAIVGITGSLGKTSVLTMLEAILDAAGLGVGAIGSEIVGIRMADHFDLATPNTTPGPLTLHRGLRLIADEGATIAVMEVTSHALDQQRIRGLAFTAGIFTNLVSLEHQDYHGSFEEYVRTKMTFCDHLAPGAPLVYGSDSERLVGRLADGAWRAVGCGEGGSPDMRIASRETTRVGTTYSLETARPLERVDGSILEAQSIEIQLRLLGRPHVLNSAYAAATALLLGVDAEVVRRALSRFEPPKRRMELIDVEGILVLDDTTGHPESVDAVFEVVANLPWRRLVLVAAIRGNRGATINRRLASAIARRLEASGGATLIATDSDDAVDDADRVTADERDAFLEALEAGGAAFRHAPRLQDALAMASDDVTAGDLVVLLGAQGMREGAERLQRLLVR